MAEIVGLAASAAGLLSLGLQVYDGIASYINDFNDRGSDISAVSTRAENIRTSITELQQILPRIAAKHTVGGTAAIPALKAADTELRALISFLDELQCPPAQVTSTRTTIREQKKKLVYPFRRPTLEKLEKRLYGANSALRTGIQSLALLVIDSIDTSVSGVIQKVDRSHAAILGIGSKTESLETSLSSIATSLIPINDTSSSMKNSLDTFMTESNAAIAGVREPLIVALPELRDGMTNVSQQLRIVEDGVQMTRKSIVSDFQNSHQRMDQLLNIVSRSAAQSIRSASLISGDFARVQRRLLEIGRLLGVNEDSTAFNPSSVALTRLSSKPSVLKDACDNFQLITADQAVRSASFKQHPQQQHSDVVLDSQKGCYCQKKTVVQQKATRFGDFYWIKKRTATQRHLSGCVFAQQSTIAIEEARIAVYNGLRGLLSVALELSISWRSGAGGFSISPNITIRPMVDEAKSPVFRMMTLMLSGANQSWRTGPLGREEKGPFVEQVLRYAAAAIIKLHHTNSCSVYDVNVQGQSALHQWTEVLAEWSISYAGFFEDSVGFFRKYVQPIAMSSIKDMLQEGIPAGLPDYSGRSASSGFFSPGFHPEMLVTWFSPILNSLPSLGHEVVVSSYQGTVMSLSKDWGDLLNNHPFMSKIFRFGPLSEAIVTGDEDRVQKLLSRKDCDLNEKNIFRQTIFHLAVSSQRPDFLRLITQAVLTTGGSQKFDTPDVNGCTALDFAVLCSGETCRNCNWPVPCIDCSCWLPFVILQPHGWQLSRFSLWEPKFLLEKPSYSCAIQLIEMIKSSRKELQAEGRRSLSRADIRSFHLDEDDVLDGYAPHVVRSLSQRGMVVPLIPQYHDLLAKGSIYHDIADCYSGDPERPLWLADLLFKNGFKNVDHRDSFGVTPLMVALGEYGAGQLSFTLWLLDHGADPFLNWPAVGRLGTGNPHLRVAHMLLRFRWDRLRGKHNFMCLREIALRIAPLELFDGCQCGCVPAGGCGTMKILFRELWSKLRAGHYFSFKLKPRQVQPHCEAITSEPLSKCKTRDRKDSKERGMSLLLHYDILEMDEKFDAGNTSISTPIIGGRLSDFLRNLAVDFSQWDHVSMAALRLFTFEALGMRHTCCEMPEPPMLSPDEIVEIQEEDQTMLALLDDLVEEFTTELRHSGDSLDKFFGRYWAGRIDEVLDELNAATMTEEQRKAAEESGIKWETSSNEWEKLAFEFETKPQLSLQELKNILEQGIDQIFTESIGPGSP